MSKILKLNNMLELRRINNNKIYTIGTKPIVKFWNDQPKKKLENIIVNNKKWCILRELLVIKILLTKLSNITNLLIIS